MDCYAKRGYYNPEVEGYGSPREWKSAFDTVMGIDEAHEQQKTWKPGTGAWGILGVAMEATWEEIRAAWGKLVREWFPEERTNAQTGEKYWHGDMKRYKDIQAAYAILKRKFGK